MPTIHYYADASLSKYCTEEREQRAIADVALLGDLPAPWPAALQRLRTYALACQECMSAPGDIFQTKLSAYTRDYDAALTSAREAKKAADSGQPIGTNRPAFVFVDLERG